MSLLEVLGLSKRCVVCGASETISTFPQASLHTVYGSCSVLFASVTSMNAFPIFIDDRNPLLLFFPVAVNVISPPECETSA